MLRAPNHRLCAVKTALSNGHELTDERELALANLLKGEECPDDSVRRALDIYGNVHKRETIESLLLAGCTVEEVDSATKVTEEITESYRHLFFDTEMFEDDLDCIAYAKEYDESEYGKELKNYAVEIGKNGLLVRISRGAYIVPPDEAHTSVRNTSYMLSQLAKSNPTDSAIAKEAYRWAQLCMRSAENSPDSNAGNPVLDLRIEVESVDRMHNAENSDLDPEDISRGD